MRRRSGSDDLDEFDHVAFQHAVDHVHAGDHRSEHSVLMVEPWRVDEVDEKLCVTGVAAARGDADGTAPVEADLVAHVERVARVLVGTRAPALNHEVGRDAVEREPVVVALAGPPRDANRGERREDLTRLLLGWKGRLGCLSVVLSLVACSPENPVGGQLQASAALPLRTDAPLRIVLISVDTLRADHMSLYGYPRSTTPRLDAWASEALVFDRAFAQFPKTGPSFGALFSGRYPQSTGMTHRAAVRIAESFETLPEALRTRGFSTSAVVSNPVLPARLGWGQGFDEYVETFAADTSGSDDPYLQRRFTEASRVNEAAFQQLRKAASAGSPGGRQFFWFHYTDPHAPYQLPPGQSANPFLGDALDVGDAVASPDGWRAKELDGRRELRYYISQYDANIRYVDQRIGELLDEARRLGLLEHSLVIFTADHGESLGEHRLFFEHGREPYNTTLRVPLVVRAEGLPVAFAKGRVSRPVELVDVYPTLAKLLGLTLPDGVEGDDLASLLVPGEGVASPSPPTSSYAFSEAGGSMRGGRTHFRVVQDSRHKLVFHPPMSGPHAPPRWELFDLEADPGEQSNLAESRPPELRRLRLALESWMRETVASNAEEDQSAETLRALRALGYLQ